MDNELFDELIESVRQGGAILRGEAEPARAFKITPPDVQGIRRDLNLTQGDFASMMGISIATLRNWEQGRRAPEGAARVLLHVAAKHPEAVQDVVKQAARQTKKNKTDK